MAGLKERVQVGVVTGKVTTFEDAYALRLRGREVVEELRAAGVEAEIDLRASNGSPSYICIFKKEKEVKK